MKNFVFTCLSIFHLFSVPSQAQKIIRPVTPPSVKQAKKPETRVARPKHKKAPTQMPAFAELELALVKGHLFTRGDIRLKTQALDFVWQRMRIDISDFKALAIPKF